MSRLELYSSAHPSCGSYGRRLMELKNVPAEKFVIRTCSIESLAELPTFTRSVERRA